MSTGVVVQRRLRSVILRLKQRRVRQLHRPITAYTYVASGGSCSNPADSTTSRSFKNYSPYVLEQAWRRHGLLRPGCPFQAGKLCVPTRRCTSHVVRGPTRRLRLCRSGNLQATSHASLPSTNNKQGCEATWRRRAAAAFAPSTLLATLLAQRCYSPDLEKRYISE